MRKSFILLMILLSSCAPVLQNELAIPVSPSPAALASTPATTTIAPTLIPSPIITPDRVYATVDASIDACGGEHTLNRHKDLQLSPDEQWVVSVCVDQGHYTRVARSDGAAKWKLPFFVDENSYGPGWYFQPYHWSKDGRYLYLTLGSLFAIDGPGLAFVEGFGLYRLELVSGDLVTWFPADISGYSFSISLDEHWFIFVDPDNRQVVRIRDMLSGNEASLVFKEKYQTIGDFVWSQDSLKVIIVAAIRDWNSSDAGFSLFSYDIETKQLTTLVDNDAHQLLPEVNEDGDNVWLSDEVLQLASWDDNSICELNIRTAELTCDIR
jgi:hypothetical protein